jgi:hypothetical protein
MASFMPVNVALAKARRSRGMVGTVLAASIALIIRFLLVAPVLVAFIVVVGGAVAWCIWLERHPENVPGSATTAPIDNRKSS